MSLTRPGLVTATDPGCCETMTLYTRLLTACLFSWLAAGCAHDKPLTLMPTPVVYDSETIDLFTRIAPALQTPENPVFYATTRCLKSERGTARYGNCADDVLHLGTAQVRIGEPGITWEELVWLSVHSNTESETPLSVAAVTHRGTLDHRGQSSQGWNRQGYEPLINALDDQLVHHKNREIMVYVHGAKTSFERGVAMAGELDHFAGRDFVSMAFLWPSHRNILYYLLREDVRRAQHASEALADLLLLLAAETTAGRINIVSWSAGGRVVSGALQELRKRHDTLNRDALRQRFRIGAVVFAAADVETDRFLERLPSISALAEQVVITVSDADDALRAAEVFMGGRARIGSAESEASEMAFIEANHLANVELVDVSRSKDLRGFDITGHHYWYRNAWSSSDLMLVLRTLLPPEDRGLRDSAQHGLWYLDPGYPDRAREAWRRSLAHDRDGS